MIQEKTGKQTPKENRTSMKKGKPKSLVTAIMNICFCFYLSPCISLAFLQLEPISKMSALQLTMGQTDQSVVEIWLEIALQWP